jgi:hypothetical protein
VSVLFLLNYIVTSIDRLLFIRYFNNVDHVPQGTFSHPTLTEILLNSEVVHSALFLPALLNSSSFFCAKFRYYIFAYVIACKPEYVMEILKNGETT